MFDSIGLPEIILIMLIIFIFFGAGKLPEVASGLGKAVRNFKKAQRGDFDDDEKGKEVIAADTTTKKSTVRKVTKASETAGKAG